MSVLLPASATACEGLPGDHYEPLNKRLVLPEANYFGRSVTALGMAAHEAGHAMRHAERCAPEFISVTLPEEFDASWRAK